MEIIYTQNLMMKSCSCEYNKNVVEENDISQI